MIGDDALMSRLTSGLPGLGTKSMRVSTVPFLCRRTAYQLSELSTSSWKKKVHRRDKSRDVASKHLFNITRKPACLIVPTSTGVKVFEALNASLPQGL